MGRGGCPRCGLSPPHLRVVIPWTYGTHADTECSTFPACHPRSRPRAHHLRQRGDRLHDRARHACPRQWQRQWHERPPHRGRQSARRAARREPAPPRTVDEPSPVRAPVRSAALHHGAAGHDPGHPALPRLRTHQRHRPQDRRTHRRALPGGHAAHHRGGARAAERGAGPRPQTDGPHHAGVGGAEGYQGGDALPARRRGLHQPGGTHLQDLPGCLHLGREERALPPGGRCVGHRLQDRR